jgi:hypothetical protein
VTRVCLTFINIFCHIGPENYLEQGGLRPSDQLFSLMIIRNGCMLKLNFYNEGIFRRD